MSLQLPAVPPSLKPVQHLLKVGCVVHCETVLYWAVQVAGEHQTRDPVITYWARVTALQVPEIPFI